MFRGVFGGYEVLAHRVLFPDGLPLFSLEMGNEHKAQKIADVKQGDALPSAAQTTA